MLCLSKSTWLSINRMCSLHSSMHLTFSLSSSSHSLNINMGYKGYLGFEYGILQAPLGPDLSGPELVAAVSNSGCLGFLRAPDMVYLYF